MSRPNFSLNGWPLVVVAVVSIIGAVVLVREVMHSSYGIDVHWGDKTLHLTPPQLAPPAQPSVAITKTK